MAMGRMEAEEPAHGVLRNDGEQGFDMFSMCRFWVAQFLDVGKLVVPLIS